MLPCQRHVWENDFQQMGYYGICAKFLAFKVIRFSHFFSQLRVLRKQMNGFGKMPAIAGRNQETVDSICN